MQCNNLILRTCVSLLKETITRVESLKGCPIPDGHLAKFLKKVESSSNFQGIALNGSLEGKVKRGLAHLRARSQRFTQQQTFANKD